MFPTKSLSKLIYWAIALCIITPIFSNIVLKIYITFRYSSVSFTLDTLFLNWNTTFPAVTVCEIYNGEKNWDISQEYFGENRDHRIDDFVSDIVFFSGECESCFDCDQIECPTNFGELMKVFRTSCEQLLTNCSWLGESFECCSQFKPLQTEYGLCFSINSEQTEPFENPLLIMNRETGPGYLQFFVSEDIQVHVHPTTEIPFMISEGGIAETVIWGTGKQIILNIVEMINDASVESFPPEQRKCKFSNEIDDTERQFYKYYSYSTCMVDCVRKSQINICHCTIPFLTSMSNDSSLRECDLQGLKCISEYNVVFNEVRRDCECLSSCEEPEYNIVYISGESSNNVEKNGVTISMIDLPTQRYIRNAVKTNLDLIISIGGIAGLFFGASVLNVIEIIYLFCIGFTDRMNDWKEKWKKLKQYKIKNIKFFEKSKNSENGKEK